MFQEFDRVKYSDEFKAPYGDRWPFGDVVGTIVEPSQGPNKYGFEGCLVEWDDKPFNPQIAGVKDLTLVSKG